MPEAPMSHFVVWQMHGVRYLCYRRPEDCILVNITRLYPNAPAA